MYDKFIRNSYLPLSFCFNKWWEEKLLGNKYLNP